MKEEGTDVVFIAPGGHKKVFQNLVNDFSAIEPPAMVGLIAGYLRQKGHSVAIIDAPNLLFVTEVVGKIFSLKPKLIVVVIYGHQPSASTQTMPAAREICHLIKNQCGDIPIMMIGTHPSALPKRTLMEESIDFVAIGEGFITIHETLQAIKSNDNFWTVRGLGHRNPVDNQHIIINQSAPLIENLDEIPGIAWDLLPMDKYRAHNWHCFDDIEKRQPYAAIYTSFGCPFKCSFCCINAPFGGSSYRMFSPDHVISEIDILVNKYGVKNIKIIDEMFVLNEAHVMGICNRIIERGYDLNIWAYARVDTVKDKYLEKLRKAGFRWLALGIESGSKDVRDGVEKGRFGKADIINVVRKIQNAGIYVGANYIFGLPDDTLETMRETFDLALEINAEWANFYCAMAYPGSKLYSIANEKYLPLPDNVGGPGWIGYSQYAYDCLPLPTDYLTAPEVLAFRDEAFYDYFTDTKYLGMIQEKFGEKAVEHIKQMTSAPPLRRKLLESK